MASFFLFLREESISANLVVCFRELFADDYDAGELGKTVCMSKESEQKFS